MLMNNQYKIAIIGPTETVSGFKSLGAVVLEATTGEEVLAHLRTIKQQSTTSETADQFAVVCVIEDLVTTIDQSEYAKAVSGPLPAVVLLPGTTGSKGFAIGRLRQLAEQAVGAAII